MTLLLTPFLMPAGFLAVAWLLGLLLARPRKTRILSRVLLISSYCVFYALATWPVANLLLEAVQSLPASTDATATGMPAAVVVLSGGAAEVDADHPFPELTRSSWRRLWRGVEVYDL